MNLLLINEKLMYSSTTSYSLELGTEGSDRFRIRAPLLHRSKAEIVRLGAELELDFSRTWSCYDPVATDDGAQFLACGACDSCQLRRKGFQEAGVLKASPSGLRVDQSLRCWSWGTLQAGRECFQDTGFLKVANTMLDLGVV